MDRRSKRGGKNKSGCDSFIPEPPKRGRDSNGTDVVPMTTDSSMVDAIPTPLGEERNSILPSVEIGHQTEKREEMG
jgi:hypothetical protein